MQICDRACQLESIVSVFSVIFYFNGGLVFRYGQRECPEKDPRGTVDSNCEKSLTRNAHTRFGLAFLQ